MKKLLAITLSLALILSLSACAKPADDGTQEAQTASDAEPYHLKIAYSPSLCQAPLHVAVEKGFFEAEGIDPENIQVEAAHVQEAIGANQVDVGFGLIGKFLLPMENGLNIRFTAGIHTGCIKIIAPADSGITSVSELRGKTIGVTGLSGAETIVTKRALASEGISFDEQNPEVEFLVFAGSDLGQALQNGAIDVIAVGDPTASQLVEEYGLTVIIDTASSEGFKDEYCCGAFVTEKLATEHPEVAAAYTRAVLKAAVWVNEHPDEAAQLQVDKNYVAGAPAFNASVLKSYNYLPSVQGGYDAIKLSVQQLTDIGILREGTDAAEFADNAYLFFDGEQVPDTYTPDEVETALSAITAANVGAVLLPADTYGEDCCGQKAAVNPKSL